MPCGVPGSTTHGTYSSYMHFACRCEPCREAFLVYKRKRYVRTKDVYRRYELKKKYNISPEDYDALFTAQGGKCAICIKPPKVFRLHTDHDHNTGTVRGLLCVSCNTKLGWLELLMKPIRQYLGETAWRKL